MCSTFVFLHPSSYLIPLFPVFLFLPSYSSLNPTGLILGCSVGEANIEDQQLDQSHCSGPKAEVQPISNDVDQERQQQLEQQELEEEPSDLDHESNTSHHHQEQQPVVPKYLDKTREVGLPDEKK